MYFDNDWVMLFPFYPPRAEPTEQFSRLTGKLQTRCFLMNTNFYLTGVSNVHTQTNGSKCLLLFRINCINIGWFFFIQLNSDMHLHNLLFWSTFRKLACLLAFQFPLSHKHNAHNLLLNFHYITHWFYHFLGVKLLVKCYNEISIFWGWCKILFILTLLLLIQELKLKTNYSK